MGEANMGEARGTIAFFATYRPLDGLDIFSRPVGSTSKQDEIRMTDGLSSNYNGQAIPSSTLKKILRRPKLASQVNDADVESGLIFVSERENSLETLHLALHFKNKQPNVKIFSFADIFDDLFNGVRMEDSGSFAGDYLVYVSTVEDPKDRRQPWTVVYTTNLTTGEADHLTLSYHADLSPAVSPSGDKIAVASFQGRGGWHGEIEDLQTNIYVTNLVKPFNRILVVENGGWPTWGSNTVIFFHRKIRGKWGVFKADISKCLTSGDPCSSSDITRVTGEDIDAMTPAAISDKRVAVATIRKRTELDVEREEISDQYRHIEIFDLNSLKQPIQITRTTRPMVDHYNPFVIDGGSSIGYHRSNSDLLRIDEDETPNQFHKLKSPNSDVGLVRVSGVFPTFSTDGTKLAFVDNEFRTVWLVEKEKPARMIYQDSVPNAFFSPVWNKSDDVLYISKGPSFAPTEDLEICAFFDASMIEDGKGEPVPLTKRGSNNAFPSSSPNGKRLVFRSVRVDEEGNRFKNLYIMEDTRKGEYDGGKITRLTKGNWIDTHCEWSPTNDWVVFSSTRDKPSGAPKLDNGLDPGFFAVYIVQADKPDVVVRVLASGYDIAGHVNHPFFSPDGKSIAVTSDLAAVSADPISLPYFLHSVRPYADIFVAHIDYDDIRNTKDVKFIRITHSRYENSTPCWTKLSIQNLDDWNRFLHKSNPPKTSLCK